MHLELRLSEDGEGICVRDASMNGVGIVGPGGGRPTPVTKGSFDVVPNGGALLVPLKLKTEHGERVLLRIDRDSPQLANGAAACARAGQAMPQRRRAPTDVHTAAGGAAAEALAAEGGAYSDSKGGDDDRVSDSPARRVPQATRSPCKGGPSPHSRSSSHASARVNVSGLWEMTSDKGRSFEYLWQHLTPHTFSGKQVGGSAVTGALHADGVIMWETGAVACKAVLMECGKRIEDGSFWRKKSGEVLGTFTGYLRKAGHMKPEERSVEEIPISQSYPDQASAAMGSKLAMRRAPSGEGSGERRGRRKQRKERKERRGTKKRRRDRSGSLPLPSPRESSRAASPRAGSPRTASPQAGSRRRSPGASSPRWRRRDSSASLRGRAQASLSRARSGNGQRDGKRRRR